MGRIINIKSTTKDNVQVTLEMSQEEVVWLAGNLENMHIFSQDNLETNTRLVQRGKRESTKYFLMPREFRDGILPSNCVKCTKKESIDEHLFIFSVPKVEV